MGYMVVYPRWRGELDATDQAGSPENGLSPLARGTPAVISWNVLPDRFIPAGAGNSLNITYY